MVSKNILLEGLNKFYGTNLTLISDLGRLNRRLFEVLVSSQQHGEILNEIKDF